MFAVNDLPLGRTHDEDDDDVIYSRLWLCMIDALV